MSNKGKWSLLLFQCCPLHSRDRGVAWGRWCWSFANRENTGVLTWSPWNATPQHLARFASDFLSLQLFLSARFEGTDGITVLVKLCTGAVCHSPTVRAGRWGGWNLAMPNLPHCPPGQSQEREGLLLLTGRLCFLSRPGEGGSCTS